RSGYNLFLTSTSANPTGGGGGHFARSAQRWRKLPAAEREGWDALAREANEELGEGVGPASKKRRAAPPSLEELPPNSLARVAPELRAGLSVLCEGGEEFVVVSSHGPGWLLCRSRATGEERKFRAKGLLLPDRPAPEDGAGGEILLCDGCDREVGMEEAGVGEVPEGDFYCSEECRAGAAGGKKGGGAAEGAGGERAEEGVPAAEEGAGPAAGQAAGPAAGQAAGPAGAARDAAAQPDAPQAGAAGGGT
ncbi:hypothetical protein TeGR_g13200, partial [Tetraparma gracilis]